MKTVNRVRDGQVSPNDEWADLVERVATSRDRDAFVRLFDHYAPRISGHLQRIGTDPATAEELAQEVMVVLWRKAALFDRQKSSVGTWLFRIARNRRIDLARRDRSGAIDQTDPSLQPSEPEDLGTQLDTQRREARIRAALSSLPAEQYELVQLAFFKGLSHTQVAAATGQPLGTVKSRLRLAFTRLRRILEADAAVDVD
ncbi:sigma-70 family RNA polymerase sigma factor [Methylobrevis sp. L22]|uniref:Sigma-70 family RNA polymerase sigma factor n=1 Tax=Methylobrevis albus TaxID=2793297 RepID=A0A931I0R4_9HYPH|nr:sigma-70 family RNA polymerase sigma factor [Methylobrevis albus]